jgi:hypothetical protein
MAGNSPQRAVTSDSEVIPGTPITVRVKGPRPGAPPPLPFAFRLIDAGAACRIEVWLDGQWQGAADIPAAHTSRMAGPRRRVVHFNPVHTDKIRLIAAKGNLGTVPRFSLAWG